MKLPRLRRRDPQLVADVAQMAKWWHSIDLGRGLVTPGHKTPELLEQEWNALQLPPLRGKTVLDIGTWDGWFAFRAEREGARRVVALDEYVWAIDWRRAGRQPVVSRSIWDIPGAWLPDELPGKQPFDLARRVLASNVEPIVADFMTTDLDALGTFDVVLFLGVVYHMRHPLLALERLRRVTGGVAAIESEAVVLRGREEEPFALFVEEVDENGDHSNWWIPTAAALAGMTRAAGFARVDVLTPVPEIPEGLESLRYRLVLKAHA